MPSKRRMPRKSARNLYAVLRPDAEGVLRVYDVILPGEDPRGSTAFMHSDTSFITIPFLEDEEDEFEVLQLLAKLDKLYQSGNALWFLGYIIDQARTATPVRAKQI